LDEKRREKIAKVMFDKTTMMMKIYLGNSPEPEEFLQFLYTTKGAKITQ